jgi:hypothetical protein
MKRSSKQSNIEKESSNKKKSTNEIDENESTFLDFSSSKGLFQSLIGSKVQVGEFFEKYWEKKPLLIERNDEKEWLCYLKTLFTYESLKEILKTNKKMEYGTDVNLCKLVDRKKTILNDEDSEFVKLKYLNDAFQDKKATVQFHQPQRFSVGLKMISIQYINI